LVKAVTFDLWNTILYEKDYGDCRIDLLTQTLNREGFSRDRHMVEVEYSSTIDFFFEVWMKERRHMPVAKLTEFVLHRLDVCLPAEVKNRLVKGFEEVILNDPPLLVENAERVLKSLHNKYAIGLISDSGVTPGRHLRRVLNDHKVLQYFRCTIFSDEVGYHKPHPTIFRKAIEKLQVKPSDIMHVGDLLESDVTGAKAIGMKTIWLNNGENKRQTKEISPDYEIKSLSELLEILEK
jgi:HAD superfamily hydrolase (TIGR01549 family)